MCKKLATGYTFKNMTPGAILMRLARETVIEDAIAKANGSESTRAVEIEMIARWCGFTSDQFNATLKVQRTMFMLCDFNVQSYKNQYGTV